MARKIKRKGQAPSSVEETDDKKVVLSDHEKSKELEDLLRREERSEGRDVEDQEVDKEEGGESEDDDDENDENDDESVDESEAEAEDKTEGNDVRVEEEKYKCKPITQTIKASSSLKQVLVGGPLLGRRPHGIPNFNGSNCTSRNSISWDIFRPVITPEIVLEKHKKSERFILLPHGRFITVLAYRTGVQIATLVPTSQEEEEANEADSNDRNDENSENEEEKEIEDKDAIDTDDAKDDAEADIVAGPDNDADAGAEEGDSGRKESSPDHPSRIDDIIIESVTLAMYPRRLSENSVQDVLDKIAAMEDHDGDDDMDRNLGGSGIVDEIVVMAGCQDGTIREFSLKSLGGPSDARNVKCAEKYQIMGPCYRPRRVIRVFKRTESVMHLTVPHLRTEVRDDGILVYAVARTKGLEIHGGEKNEAKKKTFPKGNRFSINVGVLGLLVPHFDGSTNVVLSSEGDIKRKWFIDKFPCIVGSLEKGKNITSTAPFQLISVAVPATMVTSHPQAHQQCTIFLLLARSNRISVYYQQLFRPSEQFPPIHIQMPSNNPLTVIDVSLNNADITCGHYRGNIQVLNNILVTIDKYHIEMSKVKQLGSGSISTHIPKPQDPRKNMVISRVHWHALPVTSLTYDSMSSAVDPLLYSGGDESVLVTWQLSQGNDRPADVLPRLALGGIIHLTCSDRIDGNAANGILVFCEDNSLQLFESHNKGRQWKIQGLATGRDGEVAHSRGCCLEVDPRSNGESKSQIVVTGLSRAPGYMHWFDPSHQRLASTLEVAPFNRVSRNEADEQPLPTPSIIGHAFSAQGKDLVTIEETRTENFHVGAYEKSGKKAEHGIVSTIRFWSWTDTSSIPGRASAVPFNQLASMTYPHGPKNRISALGLSKDGSMACTVSSDEKAFRLWKKILLPTGNGNPTANDPATSWTCRYKIKTPSGFSNFSTGANGVSFSDDGSIIAIAFGVMVTLWDSDDARFLTSFRCFDPHSDVEVVQFINPGRHQDLLLVQSLTGVSLRSPYGPDGTSASFRAWNFALSTDEMMSSVITSSALVESHACLAVAVFSHHKNQSRVILIDAASGNVGLSEDGKSSMGLVGGVNGRIIGLCAVGKLKLPSKWIDTNESPTPSPLTLYALTDAGNLLLFTEDSTKFAASTEWKSLSQPVGPRLDIGNGTIDRRKRQRPIDASSISLFSAESSSKKMATDIFGFAAGDDSTAGPATSALPSLSRNFVRSFVGRSLSRKEPNGMRK